MEELKDFDPACEAMIAQQEMEERRIYQRLGVSYMPEYILKANLDEYAYVLGLKNGDAIQFSSLEFIGPDWVRLTGHKLKVKSLPEGRFDRGLEVRYSEILWIADDAAID